MNQQVEERASSAGSYWSGSVKDVTVHPGPEGREIKEKTGELLYCGWLFMRYLITRRKPKV